jgi:hypothetical protein
MSRGRTTPKEAHWIEWLLVAAIDGVAVTALIAIVATVRMSRRKIATPHYDTPLSTT